MTIQLAIANSYGIALASDRHVFRDGAARSTGQECKLLRLRSAVPGVMMAAGPLAVMDVPISRLAMRLGQAISAAARVREPEALGRAVLDVLEEPFARGPEYSTAPVPDAAALLHAAEAGIGGTGVCASDLYLTVGLCCPASGVPVLVAVRMQRSVGNRMVATTRLQSEFEAIWKANRTIVVAQGSGRATIEAMIDGVADEHWAKLPGAARSRLGPAMTARWDGAHDRFAVSSMRELGAVAAGLVRGAEAIGYLTRVSEGSIAPVDCVLVTPDGVGSSRLHAGADAVAARPRRLAERTPRRPTRAPVRKRAAG